MANSGCLSYVQPYYRAWTSNCFALWDPMRSQGEYHG